MPSAPSPLTALHLAAAPRRAAGRRLLRAISAFLILASAGWTTVAQQPAAPGQLPCALAGKQPLDPADEQAIRRFVETLVPGLSDPSADVMIKSRDALMNPLSCAGITFAFRSKYADILAPSLTPLVAAKDERQAVNALLMLGRLRTTTTADALVGSLKSDNPVIRFAAASGYREILTQLSKDSFGFPDGAIDRVLDAVAAALRVEKDPLAADMLIIALGGATKGNAALRGRAMLRLTETAERRILALRKDGNADESWSPTILRALDLARQTMFEQGGAGAIDKEFARRAALLGGQVFAYARDRLVKGMKEADSDLSKAVGAADGLTVIAHQAAASQRRPDLGAQAAFDAGNAANFAQSVDTWIGAAGLLTKAPYNANAADFAPAK